MAYGLTVYNTNGTLVVNEDYSNYQVIASGTSANGTAGWASFATGDDIVWVRPHITGNYLYYPNRTGGGLQSSSGSVEWVVSRRNPAASSLTYGLRVYNSTGTIAFDAGRSGCIPVMNYRDTPNEAPASQTVAGIQTTRVNAPFAPITGRKRFVAMSCFELFLLWLLDASNAAYQSASKVTWVSESAFDVTVTAIFVNSVAANVIYAKPVGAINYFWADFAV